MKTSYDYTKDERYKSYEQLVYDSLIKLGFRITNVGTLYLRDLILFVYFNNYYEISITKVVNDFMLVNKIDYISSRTFINCMNYSINNYDLNLFKNGFKSTFGIDYDYYCCSVKNLIILYLNLLKK